MKKLILLIFILTTLSCGDTKHKHEDTSRVSPVKVGQLVYVENSSYIVNRTFSYVNNYSETISLQKVNCTSDDCYFDVLPEYIKTTKDY